MAEYILQNPFYTDSASKAYEQALLDMMNWLILHNRAYEVRTFALAFPFFLDEESYWALRRRVGLSPSQP